MKRVIDCKTWDREASYRLFERFLVPNINITSEVDCTKFVEWVKAKKESLFIHYFYAVLKASNEIENMRYRIDGQEQIVMYDRIDGISVIRVGENGRYVSRVFTYMPDRAEFYAHARHVIDSITDNDSSFGAEESCDASGEYNALILSAMPDLSFSGISLAHQGKESARYQILTVGKIVERNQKKVMPVAINCNHGFVDGFHIAEFYRIFGETLEKE